VYAAPTATDCWISRVPERLGMLPVRIPIRPSLASINFLF
jgi:hypothetical protein